MGGGGDSGDSEIQLHGGESNIPIGLFPFCNNFIYIVTSSELEKKSKVRTKAMEDEEEEPCVLIGNGMRLVEMTDVPMGLFYGGIKIGGEGGGRLGRNLLSRLKLQA